MAESRLEKLAAKQEYGTELCRFLGVLEKNAQLVGIGADLVADAVAERREESGIVKIALACIGMAFVSDDSTAGGGASYRLDDLEAEGLAEFAAHCTPAGNFRYWDFRLREKKPETSGGLFG